MSVTTKLVDLVQQKEVTDQDLDMVALFTLDALSAIIAGRFSSDALPLMEWVKKDLLNVGREAFVMGALSNVLELDSMHRKATLHAGTVVVPAALAVGRDRKAGGKAILSAILKGSEVAIRIGGAVGQEHYKLFQSTSTCGPFGAAMAAGCLLGLDRAQMVDAMGNAGTQAGGFWEFIGEGVLSKQFHAGRAAEAGVVSAELAAHGFSGPRNILEGERGFFAAICPGGCSTDILDNRDEEWGLWKNSYKLWPTPRHTHPTIDAALALRGRVKDRRIEFVEIDTYPVALDLCNQRNVTSAHTARFSLAFCALAALRDGYVNFETFSKENIARHVDHLPQVDVAATDTYALAYPESWGAEIRVYLNDGEVIRASKKNAKGDPEAPMTREEMLEKAETLLTLGEIENVAQFVSDVINMSVGGNLPKFEILDPSIAVRRAKTRSFSG